MVACVEIVPLPISPAFSIMSPNSPLVARALTQAREDWLHGDPSAWSRYTNCIERLEDHARDQESMQTMQQDRPAMPRWNPLSSPHPLA